MTAHIDAAQPEKFNPPACLAVALHNFDRYEGVMLVKKYGNRRLYDTESSRYITLDDLTGRIRDGADAKVIDAKTTADLTQTTLRQILIEGRGASRNLPTAVLHQLIRLSDDVLADFLGRALPGALEAYVQAPEVAPGDELDDLKTSLKKATRKRG